MSPRPGLELRKPCVSFRAAVDEGNEHLRQLSCVPAQGQAIHFPKHDGREECSAFVAIYERVSQRHSGEKQNTLVDKVAVFVEGGHLRACHRCFQSRRVAQSRHPAAVFQRRRE